MEISLLVEILVVIVVGNELWVNNVSNGQFCYFEFGQLVDGCLLYY